FCARFERRARRLCSPPHRAGTALGNVGAERGPLPRQQVHLCRVGKRVRDVASELHDSMGHRNRGRRRADLLRPYALLEPSRAARADGDEGGEWGLCVEWRGGAFGRSGVQGSQALPSLPAELELGAFMRSASRRGSAVIAPCVMLAAAVVALVSASAVAAQSAQVEELVSAVVRINTHINPEGRTVQGLGREREGSGIVIASDGLVLTIGYLMVQPYAAETVDNNGHAVPGDVGGYAPESGFGLLRAIEPLKLKPMALGKSAEIKEGDPVLIASFGGAAMVAGAYVVAKREFAGSWEYMLEDALFTAPPHPAWSGAALINREGKLVGVG